VSLYCNKFKIFAIIARLGPCGTLGKEFKKNNPERVSLKALKNNNIEE